MQEPTALQSLPSAALDRPAFVPLGDTRGTEAIDRDDLRLPRLVACQPLSPQRSEGDPKFIPGLAEGDLFNDLTKRIYGRGPIDLVVVRFEKRGVQFGAKVGDPIVDLSVPLDDPRMAFTKNDATGLRDKPVATLFYDYVALVLPDLEPVVLSLKSTQLKKGKQLNSLIRLRNAPAFAGKYRLTTAVEKSGTYTFRGYVIDNAGWVDEPTFRFAERFHASIAGKTIVVEREPDDEPFVGEGGETKF